jgi:hypothetical protein
MISLVNEIRDDMREEKLVYMENRNRREARE